MTTRTITFRPAAAAQIHHVLGSVHTNALTPADTGGLFSMLHLAIPPGCGAPMHWHERDSECFYVLEGELSFDRPDGSQVGRPGDVCFAPAGALHGFHNPGDVAAKAVVVITPGVEASRFFDEVDAPLAGEVDVPVVMEIASRNGISFPASAAA